MFIQVFKLFNRLIIFILNNVKYPNLVMIDIKISYTDSSRQKIVILISRETRKELKTNIELGRINLDRWLRD